MSVSQSSSAAASYPSTSDHYQYRSIRPTAPSPRDPTIRHAGRAHIRGKIRRVWRPRYLELCDTGLVRYYELPPTADVTLPEDSDWDHVNMIPKDTLVIFHARIIDVTTLRDLHVGLPKGSYGFLFRGQRQSPLELQGPNAEPPREYFCAVSTLEEAQTWVIVLQWAASLETHRRSLSSGSIRTAGINFLGDSCHIPNSSMIPTVVGEVSTGATRYSKSHGDVVSLDGTNDLGSASGATTTTTGSINSPTAAVVVTKTKRKPVGRIVVTKVEGYRLVKVPSSAAAAVLLLQWQVAYDLGILMIQGSKVEERRILRTAFDLRQLLEELSREVDSKISLNLVDEWKSKIAAHPLPPQNLHDYRNVKAIVPMLISSFGFVDRMLRALAMDANIVNSEALKRCFVLDTDQPKVTAVTWWKTLSPKALATSLTHRRRATVSEESIDTFVKTWLSSHAKPSSDWKIQTIMWVLQRPWIVLGGTGVGLALSVPLAKAYQHMMVSIDLRLDFLVGSWCLAAYLGREYGGSILEQRKRNPPRAPLPSNCSVASRTVTNSLKSAVVVSASSTDSQDVVEHEELDASSMDSKDDVDYLEHHEDDDVASVFVSKLSSPLPQYPQNNGESCWSSPPDNSIFRVRGHNYLEDRIKIPSGPSPFKCRGVDVWLTDNPLRHIARHPSVLNGKLQEEDTFLVNFLLPFGNFVSYFTVPPLALFPDKLGEVWSKFVKGDQEYRDARLKLLPVVIDGPWLVRAAVGNGTAPALLGKVIPLQYFFSESRLGKKAVYEVDVIITASSIAKGILSVVKGHTKSLQIAFAFIIEAAEQEELPETVLCAFQVHQLHLEDCPHLPEYNLDA